MIQEISKAPLASLMVSNSLPSGEKRWTVFPVLSVIHTSPFFAMRNP